MDKILNDEDMSGVIKKISIHEYFLLNSRNVEWLNENNTEFFWEVVSNNFKTSLKYHYLKIKEKDDEVTKNQKKTLASAYLKYLETANTFIFKSFYEIFYKIYYKAEENIYISNLFKESKDIYLCFEKEYPNCHFSEIVDYRNFELQNRENFLDVLSEEVKFFENELSITELDAFKSKFNKNFFNKKARLNERLKDLVFDMRDFLNIEEKSELSAIENKKKENKIDELSEEDKALYEIVYQKAKEFLYQEYKPQKEEKKEHEILSVEEAVAKNFADVIGLQDEKQELIEIAKFVNKSFKPTDLSMLIYGESGVGKSMFVECAGKSFYDCGLLKSSKYFRITGSELQAEYVGQTAPKIEKIFKDNRYGTIFIDEAYTIGDKKEGGFVKDALGKLMIELEKIRTKDPDDKTFFAMAGYKDKMGELLKINPGLESRMANLISLKSYDNEEMFAFFKKFMEENLFMIDNHEEKAFKELFIKHIDVRRAMNNFSNARLARNIADKVMRKQSARTDLYDRTVKLCDLEKVVDFENKNMLKSNNKLIGFGNEL